jgi:NAD(P)-dependent dehydrogenase (short-subunit alcohol dehydrogenase family)
MRYANKIVLVTGGGSGIGRALARGFAQQGATVVVSGRGRDALERTVKLVENEGGQAAAVAADVTRSADLAQLMAALVDRYGHLDVAVNSAGTFTAGSTAQLADDEWARVLDVNATGVFLAMKHEIAAMRKGGGGAIVNIGSSIGAHMRMPGLGAYAASKAAVSALSRTAALEYIRDGIRINAVSPGPVDTPMSLLPGETEAQRAERLSDALPIGRVGALAEITATVLWLASEEAGFVVGHDLVIDGGATA